jgi:hypothetical protein
VDFFTSSSFSQTDGTCSNVHGGDWKCIWKSCREIWILKDRVWQCKFNASRVGQGFYDHDNELIGSTESGNSWPSEWTLDWKSSILIMYIYCLPQGIIYCRVFLGNATRNWWVLGLIDRFIVLFAYNDNYNCSALRPESSVFSFLGSSESGLSCLVIWSRNLLVSALLGWVCWFSLSGQNSWSSPGQELTVSLSLSLMLRPTMSASLSWNKAPVWGLRPDFCYC